LAGGRLSTLCSRSAPRKADGPPPFSYLTTHRVVVEGPLLGRALSEGDHAIRRGTQP
jgi:hypothetical protein